MKNKKLYRICVVLLALVFVVSGAVVVHQLHDRHMASQAYDEALALAMAASGSNEDDKILSRPELHEYQTVSELEDSPLPMSDEPKEVEEAAEEETVETPPRPLPEEVQFLLETDLAALREVNGDVLGWIHIPDTAISYPLMRSRDNQEYLGLRWDKVPSSAGSIFLECRSSADFSDFHSLIYGHNMKSGAMFSDLRYYQSQSFMEKHPYVYIVTDDCILQYEVFSAYTAEISGDAYRLYFESNAIKRSVIHSYAANSVLESEIIPQITDRILTLSTCTGMGNYNYRWAVHTVLIAEYPR